MAGDPLADPGSQPDEPEQELPDDGYRGLAPPEWPRRICPNCLLPVPLPWWELHKVGEDPDRQSRLDEELQRRREGLASRHSWDIWSRGF